MDNFVITLDNETHTASLSYRLKADSKRQVITFPAFHDVQDKIMLCNFLNNEDPEKIQPLLSIINPLIDALENLASELPGSPRIVCLCPPQMRPFFTEKAYDVYGKQEDGFMLRSPEEKLPKATFTPTNIQLIEDKKVLFQEAANITTLANKNAYWLEQETMKGLEARIQAAEICLGVRELRSGFIRAFVRAVTDGNTWYISDMIVDESMRNQKIGTFLLGELLKRMPRDRDWTYLHAADKGPGIEAARKLYEKFGFQFDQRGKMPVALVGRMPPKLALKPERDRLFSTRPSEGDRDFRPQPSFFSRS